MKAILQGLCILLLSSGLAACALPKIAAERDVSYGEVDGEKLLLDVFHPASPALTLRPAVILVHGGGWSAGSKEIFSDAANGLAQQGYVAFSINYRLAANGRNSWPAPPD